MCSIKPLICIECFWETLVIYFTTAKLESISLRNWEQSISETYLPNLAELKQFLENRANILEAIEWKQTSDIKAPNVNKPSFRSLLVNNAFLNCQLMTD